MLTVENPPSWLSGKAARLLGDLAIAGMLGSILVALPLMVFNNWWVRALGTLYNKFKRGSRIAAAPAVAEV